MLSLRLPARVGSLLATTVLIAGLLPGCTGRPGDGGPESAAPVPRPPAPGVAPAKPAEEILLDEAYRMLLGGRAAGYKLQQVHRLEDGRVRSRTRQKMTVRRGEVPLTTEVDLRVTEKPDGGILGFEITSDMAASETRMVGRVEGDEIRMVVTTMAGKRQVVVPYDRRARGPHHLEREAHRRLRAEGDTYEELTLLPDLQKTSRVTFTRGPESVIEVEGKEHRVYRREARVALMPAATLIDWVDGEGRTWKGVQRLPGLEIEYLRAPADIVETWEAGDPPEIFIATSVRPDRPLPDPAKTLKCSFRVSLLQGEFDSLAVRAPFRTAGQTVVETDSPSSRIVKVARIEVIGELPLPLEVPAGLEPYLEASPMIESDDPAIRERARAIVEGIDDAHEATLALVRFVHDHIRDKNLTTGFASARETLDTRGGDCTEHGVLLAALARAAGYPARIVTGLVHHEGRFVGHLWTEIFLGIWVPFDATRPEEGVGIGHLGLTTSALKGAQGSDVFLDLASLLGNLRLEILPETP